MIISTRIPHHLVLSEPILAYEHIRARFILLLGVSLGSRDVKGVVVQSRAGSGPQKAWGHKTEWQPMSHFSRNALVHHGSWKNNHVAILRAQEIKTQNTVSICHNSKAVPSHTASGWKWIVSIFFFQIFRLLPTVSARTSAGLDFPNRPVQVQPYMCMCYYY